VVTQSQPNNSDKKVLLNLTFTVRLTRGQLVKIRYSMWQYIQQVKSTRKVESLLKITQT